MPRRLPSLNALKNFEAAARHQSFTRAAEELCVTQGAVSHQIKALESGLGVKLFKRERQHLVLTEAGRDYLSIVRDAFDRLALGTERLVQRQRSNVLTVSTSPDFAAKWLVHRISRFTAMFPDIELRLSATMHHVDFAREEIDVAVRHGDGRWPELDGARLCPEQLLAVCSPRLIAGRRRPRQPADVANFPLLHLDDQRDWADWLEAAGVRLELPPGLVLNRASLVIDAAIDGQGIGLARTLLATRDLAEGRLVRPFAFALPLSKSYWIVCPRPAAALPKVASFRRWLLAEAAADRPPLTRSASV